MISDGANPLAQLHQLSIDRSNGAAFITLAAAETLQKAIEEKVSKEDLSCALVNLFYGQRAMAPLVRFVFDCLTVLMDDNFSDFTVLKSRAKTWQKHIVNSNKLFTEHLCNCPPEAKSFAFFSYSSTVNLGIKTLFEKGIKASAFVGRSYPGGEGEKTASLLNSLAWDVKLLHDSHLMDKLAYSKVDCLVLGCDAMDESRFVNKIGSAALTTLAKSNGIRVEIWTSSIKFLPAPHGIDCLDLKEPDVTRSNGEELGIESPEPLFGFGSLNNIDYIRTEDGLFKSSDIVQQIRDMESIDFRALEEKFKKIDRKK